MMGAAMWKTLALGLAIALLGSGGLAGYLYQRGAYLDAEISSLRSVLGRVSYSTDILVDYGNGTKKWYNETRVAIGSNLFNATLQSTGGSVEYSSHPQLGIFVTGINGLSSSKSGQQSKWWSVWRWDKGSRGWVLSDVGAAQLLLHENDIVAWKFVSANEWPPKPP